MHNKKCSSIRVTLLATFFCIATHLFFSSTFVRAQTFNGIYTIPAHGNSYITSNANASQEGLMHRDNNLGKEKKTVATVGNDGIFFLEDTKSIASTYFFIVRPATPKLSIEVKGVGTLLVRYAKQTFRIKVKADKWETRKVGKIKVEKTGYAQVNFQCIGEATGQRLQIRNLLLDGLDVPPLFIHPDFSTHFGRRGPSVHLQYRLPKKTNTEWFYNEVTVPQDGDVIGSYYCAQAFDGGYFGFQNNSRTERRVLFSIWSPFETQNPQLIPEDSRVKLLRKGERTKIGEFGNEGSGSQSYLLYPWKAGNTYRFLLHVKPNGDNTTNYTAYFYAPEEKQWILISEFRRPKTNLWIQGEYSFVENFSPEQGYKTRRANFGNVWSCSDKGEWQPIKEATFTNDNTGHSGIRVDYLGGISNQSFFLQMGGFFGNGSTAERHLTIEGGDTNSPTIDFRNLP
ncbi:MAG: DUF3472 domain-containing protein [Bacteroidaceae bacterium]